MQLKTRWLGSASFELRSEGGFGSGLVGQTDILRSSTPGPASAKGLVTRVCLECLRKNQEASVAGSE